MYCAVPLSYPIRRMCTLLSGRLLHTHKCTCTNLFAIHLSYIALTHFHQGLLNVSIMWPSTEAFVIISLSFLHTLITFFPPLILFTNLHIDTTISILEWVNPQPYTICEVFYNFHSMWHDLGKGTFFDKSIIPINKQLKMPYIYKTTENRMLIIFIVLLTSFFCLTIHCDKLFTI